ncbi:MULTISPECIES: hypothetical protein [Bacillus]|uniref:hypothetical protein n=1 Tax=Bacillus TaxID=1386 RepID=UPI001E3000CB|nr:hypothetical protein [Bacillus wiedmannii]MCC2379596.1 hypothetical protein [Bacillus wiedmannii]MCC2423704.1 hypothetical protein [Bacillus wiedmannii]MCU5094956.1 hypothetical protein [Bacillus wiedmannii]
MDINVIEEHVQAFGSARANGILDVYSDKKIQVNDTLFEKLLNEKGSLEVKETGSRQYPVKAEFTKNGFTYFSLYTAKEFEKKFGGNIDECITKK